MKIAIDARPLNHNRRHGIFTYTERLIYELSEIDSLDQYFLMYCSLRKKADQLSGPDKVNFFKKILKIPDQDFLFKDTYLSSVALPRFLKHNDCHVFHSTFDTLLLKIKRCRYVLTVHDLKSLYINDDQWNQHLPSYFKAMKCADIIIAVSQSTKNDIIKHFNIPAEKIRVVYLGAEESFQKIDAQVVQSVLKKYGITKNYFLTVGRVPRKNAERVIQAYIQCKYNRDYDLVLLGATNDCVLLSQYKKYIKEYDLGERVKLVSYVEGNDDLAAFYNGATSFVFPSLYEGFGLPVLEAMASGTPVITSNVSSLPEVAGEAVLYVNPYNEGAIARAMEKIVEDDTLRENCVSKGLLRAKMFSWKKTAKETLNIYQSLAC